MASLQLKQLVKSFGQTKVIHGVDLQVDDGEFVVFVGPSGCGKSTLLRLICGLEEATSGDILLDGQRVNEVRAADRGLAMVFQSYALYPHMTVFQNMAFGLQNIGTSREEVQAKVDGAAKLLQLDELLQRKPTQLSRRSCCSSTSCCSASPPSFRVASASASRSAAPSCASRRSSCSTNRCPISTPNCACRCVARSPRCIGAWARR